MLRPLADLPHGYTEVGSAGTPFAAAVVMGMNADLIAAACVDLTASVMGAPAASVALAVRLAITAASSVSAGASSVFAQATGRVSRSAPGSIGE